MKMVSTLALAAVLTLGIASPAMAQKRGKQQDPAAEPALNVSPAFRKPAADAETALKANDWTAAETALAAAEAVAKNPDEIYYSAYLRLVIEVHKQNKPGIVRAADALIANPKTPPSHLAEYNYKRAQATFYDGKRPEALPFLLKARELGSTELDLPFMLAQIYGDAGKVPEAIAEMSKGIDQVKAAGKPAESAWYEWAFARVYKSGDRAGSTYWMMRIVTDFPTLANWRRMVILYRDGVDAAKTPVGNKEQLDLYRLMRASGALVDRGDYYNYAKASLGLGLPWETVAVIDEGRNSGKLPIEGADTDVDKLYTGGKTGVRNEGSLDALAKASKTGKDSAGYGDALLASGNAARALEMYDLALQQGGGDANSINLHRAVAMVALGRKDEARTVFGTVTGSPLGDIAKLWVTWMDLPPLK